MGDELYAALRCLQGEEGSSARHAAALHGLVVTGTGFFGDSRAAIRELARLAGVTYSGDLVNGYTTHVVVASADHAQHAGSTRKLAKAAQWGVPCLRLTWLLDSIKAGSVQPVQPYLLAAEPVEPRQGQQAAAGSEQAEGCQQLPGRHRPSSVASNALAAVAAEAQAQQGAAVQGSRGEASPGLPQPQPSSRAALSPVDNLRQQLERMSVSPEPLARNKPGAAARPHDSPLHQRSEAPSPQRSLSLQGLVASGGRAEGSGPPEVSSACPAGVDEPWQCTLQAEGAVGSMHSGGFSPMQASPLCGQKALPEAGHVQDGGPPPFSFSQGLAGSPMLDSPAAAASAGSPAPMSGSSAVSSALASRSRLGSAAREAARNSSQKQVCSMPTPACMRAWSDDGSELGGSHELATGGSPAEGGVTQTPAAVRQVLNGGLSPTQSLAPRQLQPAQQQAAPEPCPTHSRPHSTSPDSSSQPQRRQQWQEVHEARALPRTPAAVRDWTDDETEASEQPQAGELVVSDSDSELTGGGVPGACSPSQQAAPLAPGAAAMEAPKAPPADGPSQHLQALPAAPPPGQQPRLGLLKVSRTSAPGVRAASAAAQSGGRLAPATHGSTSTAMPVEPAGGNGPSNDEHSSGCEDFPTPAGHARVAGLTGLTQLDPASIVIARPHHAGSASSLAGGGVAALKWLQRPSRGNVVRERHGLASLKGVQFAEQVQLSAAGGLLLSTKDKKTAVRLRPGGLSPEEAEDDDFKPRSSSGGRLSRGGGTGGQGGATVREGAGPDDEPVLGEPQAFYRLPDGSWWLEHCRFYSAAQAEAAAAAAGAALALPHGFDRDSELLKAVGRETAPISDVAGGQHVRRVKQGSAMLRVRGGGAGGGSRSYFWRAALDTATWRVVTDRPPADFVAID